ncbi:MAG TPA: hypothetical protein VIP05_15345 [Burkholderiaceae bacterium]
MRLPRPRSALLALSAIALSPLAAHATVNGCTLDGQPVDLSNGSTTAGKTGMIHCFDGDGRPQRDIELKNGRQAGTMRWFHKGVLQKESMTNERGNADGLSRTYAATPGKNPLLHEETAHDGTAVGLVRDWYPDGVLQRLSWRAEDGREAAAAGFTTAGKLSALTCFSQPVFAPDFDDAAACGFRKGPQTVELFAPKGWLAARVTYDHGERRHIENLWESGRPQQVVELGTASGSEIDFAEDGTKRKALAWIVQPSGIAGKPGRRVLTLQQDFHDSGPLVRERRWTPNGHGADLALDETWYLNGQPRAKDEYLVQDGQPVRRATTYFDDGKTSSVGLWALRGESDDHPIGVHQSFDTDGRLRGETSYDARGRVTRERALDESGKVTRDDQVFEDGSRKAFAK